MNELLTKVLGAHGGLERWRSYIKVEANFVSGNGFIRVENSSIRVRGDLLRFGLLYSHRRSLSNTNLPNGMVENLTEWWRRCRRSRLRIGKEGHERAADESSRRARRSGALA
jgi:hypothetical protein